MRRVREKKHVEVATASGSVRAQAVVIATSAPLADLLGVLRRHLHHQESYAVVTEPLPAAVRRELGKRGAAMRDGIQSPAFPALAQGRPGTLRRRGPGADRGSRQREDPRPAVRPADVRVVDDIHPGISGALPELVLGSPRTTSTSDGLPYIGLDRNFPRHLFALGHSRHGAALSWLAARLLLRLAQDSPEKGDELYGFSRILK